MDTTIRKYNKVTSFEEKRNQRVANGMRLGAKEKVTKLTMKMGKLLAMANLTHDPVHFLKRLILLQNHILFVFIVLCILHLVATKINFILKIE